MHMPATAVVSTPSISDQTYAPTTIMSSPARAKCVPAQSHAPSRHEPREHTASARARRTENDVDSVRDQQHQSVHVAHTPAVINIEAFT